MGRRNCNILFSALATRWMLIYDIPHIDAFSQPSFRHFSLQNFRTGELRKFHAGATMSNDQDANKISPTSTSLVHIICLHGKGNDGPAFQSLLDPLQVALKERLELRPQDENPITLNWIFLSAPFPMATATDSTITNEPNQRKREWWRLPPQTRSFTAKEYIGFEESETIVLDTLEEIRDWQKHQDEGVSHKRHLELMIGHSQGAILLASMLAKHDNFGNCPHRGFILNGCAWPNPYAEQLQNFGTAANIERDEKRKDDKNCSSSQTLFVIGESDSINPPQSAKLVRDSLKTGGMEPKTVYHKGSHAVPVKDQVALKEIVDWIEDWIKSHR